MVKIVTRLAAANRNVLIKLMKKLAIKDWVLTRLTRIKLHETKWYQDYSKNTNKLYSTSFA